MVYTFLGVIIGGIAGCGAMVTSGTDASAVVRGPVTFGVAVVLGFLIDIALGRRHRGKERAERVERDRQAADAEDRRAAEARDRAAVEAATRQAAEQAAEQARAAERQARMQARLRDTEVLPSRVLEQYTCASDALGSAELHLREAERHRRASAFTPFWEACERSLASLAAHRESLAGMRTDVEHFHSAISELARISPEVLDQAGRLPAELREVPPLDGGERVAARVRDVMYSAQSDFQFASIFEQRRTTAAVIAGFGSVSEAMSRMATAIHDSQRELRASVELAAEESRTIAGSIDRNFDIFSPLGTNVGVQIRELNQRMAAAGR